MRAVRVKGESRCFSAKGGWDASQTTRTFSEQVGPLCSVCWWEQPRQNFDEDLRSGASGRGDWCHQLLGASTHYLGASTLDLGWFVQLRQNMAREFLNLDTQRWSGGLSQRKPFLGPLLPSPRTPTLSVLCKSPMQDFVLTFFSENFQSMWPFKYKKKKKKLWTKAKGRTKNPDEKGGPEWTIKATF